MVLSIPQFFAVSQSLLFIYGWKGHVVGANRSSLTSTASSKIFLTEFAQVA